MQKKIVKGFTLIELLVVMAILSILSGAGVLLIMVYKLLLKKLPQKLIMQKL